MARRLDEVDRRILYRLVQDARDISAPQIAEEVQVSPATIRNRIAQLEEDGIVRGYHADVDYQRVGDRLTNLYVCTVPVAERERVAQQVLDIPGVVHVREILSGEENLHVKAIGEDMGDLTRIARKLTKLDLEIRDEHLLQREHHRPYHPFGPDDGPGRAGIKDAMSLTGDAEIVEITVEAGSPLEGATLEEASADGDLAADILVIGIERGDQILTPKGETRFEADDLVTLFSRRGIPESTIQAFARAGD